MRSIRKKSFLSRSLSLSTFLLCLLFQFAPAMPRAAEVPADPGLRFSVTPLIGLVGGLAGAGLDFGAGVGHGAFGFRYASGSEFCFMCDRPSESETQTAVLAGLRQEFPAGVISFRSGFALIERGTKDSDYGNEIGPGIRNHTGYGVPFQLDLALTGRYVGLCLSATVLADGDGGSAGLMLGLPVGLLRW